MRRANRPTGHLGLVNTFFNRVSAPCMALLALLVVSMGFGTASVVSAQEIAPQALEQIAALVEEKRSRTPAQQKISSQLLYELDARRGSELLERLPDFNVPHYADDRGTVLVDLDAVIDDSLLGWIETLGGAVESAFPRWNAVRASLPIEQLEALAELSQVRSMRPADAYMTQMINTTEGDVAHGTDTARVTFGVDGTGVKVGAMSDSVDALASLQASGDLPPVVTVLPGQSGNPGTSEGTALLEIIHDMAPGAELFFATGIGGQAQMAQNILDLAAAGCQIIVDDVGYFAEFVFQDGIIAQAVDEVTADGVTYFSAAGNSGNLAAGTSGVWEGDYLGVALPGPLEGAGISAHDFGGGQNSNEVTFDSPFFFTLQWSDPGGASNNDYDLFLLDDTLTNVLGASTNVQNGTQNPFEFLDTIASDDLGNRLVVVKFDGEDRFLHLNTHRGQLDLATDGQIFGHPAAEGAIAVAAVNVATAGGGVFTGGPANPVEPFSSDGPRRIFFEADGTPVNPFGDGEDKGGQPSVDRQGPDIAAADGVSTATPGFNPFFGTSASAPHAAGIGALLKQLISSLSPNGMNMRIKRNILDIEDPGSDQVSGSGIPIGDALKGKLGFQGDDFSIKTLLAKLGGPCRNPHVNMPNDNPVNFDGLEEFLDAYTNGTQPFVFEFESDPNTLENDKNASEGGANNFQANINIESQNPTDDLFPEGFEDPETGTPLDSACIEIGIDDFLDPDCPVNVTSAIIQFLNNGTSVGSFDVTSQFFNDPWDGKMSVVFDGLAGQGINEVKLNINMDPSTSNPIFADGFESGDATSWTDSSP